MDASLQDGMYVQDSATFQYDDQIQAQIDAEERKFLGISETNTWGARFMESIQTSVIAKLLNGVAFDFDEYV